MEMKQCAKGGHYYDASIHSKCPYCVQGTEGFSGSQNVGQTVPVTDDTSSVINQTRSRDENMSGLGRDDVRTMAVVQTELGIDPVVGWLVCIDGKEKGRDYRIHSDNNFIGRSKKMDICMHGDETISRENHAVISFDTRDNIYYFSPGEGRSIVRLNNRALFNTTELTAYDTIEIGKTKLLFIPFCGERFVWKNE
ncbi:MAG: FHA domain-containing protein [Desulfitobacteriaceae bacterium]